MKKMILLLLFYSAISYGQAEFKYGILVNSTKKNDATRVVVQDSITKKYHWQVLSGFAKGTDILEYPSAINLPVTGLGGKIYVTIDNNRMYRWDGTIYAPLLAPLQDLQSVINIGSVANIGNSYVSILEDQGGEIVSELSSGNLELSKNSKVRVTQNFATLEHVGVNSSSSFNLSDFGSPQITYNKNILGFRTDFGFTEPIKNTFIKLPAKPIAGNYTIATLDDIPSPLDISGKENLANKQNSLAVDGTGVKYPTVDATNAGLALKQNTLTNPITGSLTTNNVPKATGANVLGSSSITETFGRVGINDLAPASQFNVSGIVSGVNTRLIAPSGSMVPELLTLELRATPAADRGLGIVFKTPAGTGVSSNGASIFSGISSGTSAYLAFSTGTTGVLSEKARITTDGKLLVGTVTNNGIDAIQTPLTVTFAAGITANQGVVKSQLDLKADLISPTFTGVPNVPTASLGTNNTQIASTAFVLANTLNLTGDQSLTGIKTFTRINMSSSTSLDGAFNMYLTGSGRGFNNINTGSGDLFNTFNQNTGTGNRIVNQSTGVANITESSTGSTGDLYQFKKNGVTTSSINHLGEITTPKITMTGLITMKEYTVATLPSPTGTAYATVTDALAPTYMTTVVGGGTVVQPVFFNGTNWVAH